MGYIRSNEEWDERHTSDAAWIKEPFRQLVKLLTHRRHGRRKPYSEAGIHRLPCFRCGSPSTFQWQICADGNLFRPLCADCDVALNEMVLKWTGDPDAAAKMATYRAKVQA